jgi:hypothetical protein
MAIKEVNQGLEQITYVGHEGAMDVQELTVTIDTVQPANAHSIVTYKNGTALVAGTSAPRDWTHMILRKRTSDGREFIMEPAGDDVDSIISNKNQYVYDSTTREIFVSGYSATDTYLLSCFTTAGANLAPLSFVESLNISENLAIRKVYDRKTLDHFKHGRPDPSASMSQKFVDFFEPENVRQLYSPARALVEFYGQEFANTAFGAATGGAADVYVAEFKYAGSDQTVADNSSNFLRTPAGADLTEAANLTELQANPDYFLISTVGSAETANGTITVADYTGITAGKPDSRSLTIDTAASSSGNIDIDVNVGVANSQTVAILDSDSISDICDKIVTALNAGTPLFHAISDGVDTVTFYEKGATGDGSNTITLTFTDTGGTSATATVNAQVDGNTGDSLDLEPNAASPRIFEFVVDGLAGNGVTAGVASGTGVIDVGTSNDDCATNISTALGVAQTLTGEVNSPSVSTNVVQLESAIGGTAENNDISGESISTDLVVAGMAGGAAASGSVLYVSTASGTPLETGNYKLSYQKVSTACAPTLIVRNDVLDCSDALLFSEYMVAVTPASMSWSAPAEDDATMSFDLLVGVKPGNNKSLT